MGFKTPLRVAARVPHILDDFFIGEPFRLQCLTQASFSTLLRFFMSVHASVVASKTLGPSQVLEFMGIELRVRATP